MRSTYQRKVDKKQIPTCNIMGVNIAAINMEWLLEYLDKNLEDIKGDYICVSNVHTTVTSYEHPSYCSIQKRRTYGNSRWRTTFFCRTETWISKYGTNDGAKSDGRDIQNLNGERIPSLFYGSTEETLELLYKKLNENYPGIQIAGMYSPPFRPMTEEEDKAIVERINEVNPDFVWVGLGAPKQEKWMAEHQGKIDGLMLGVGAGFDYYAENIKRAPEWMQKSNLEWLYRLIQDPKRLFKRYLVTNTKFIWNAMIRGK